MRVTHVVSCGAQVLLVLARVRTLVNITSHSCALLAMTHQNVDKKGLYEQEQF